jgi:hypothetical protein
MYPACDGALNVGGGTDHWVPRVAVDGDEPHLVQAVVADIKPDAHQQNTADCVEVRHNSAHPVHDDR